VQVRPVSSAERRGTSPRIVLIGRSRHNTCRGCCKEYPLDSFWILVRISPSSGARSPKDVMSKLGIWSSSGIESWEYGAPRELLAARKAELVSAGIYECGDSTNAYNWLAVNKNKWLRQRDLSETVQSVYARERPSFHRRRGRRSLNFRLYLQERV